MNEIKFKIVNILADQWALDKAELTDTAKFYDDLGVDSLDYYQAIAAVEKEFNIAVDEEDMTRLTTMGALAAYIIKKAPHQSVSQAA